VEPVARLPTHPDGHYRIAVVRILRHLIGNYGEQQAMFAQWGQLQHTVAASLQDAQHVGHRRAGPMLRINEFFGHERDPPAA
jgi:hypothetical protein